MIEGECSQRGEKMLKNEANGLTNVTNLLVFLHVGKNSESCFSLFFSSCLSMKKEPCFAWFGM